MPQFQYQIERSRKLTASTRITISEKKGVIVRAPFWVPEFSIRNFVEERSDWIMGQLARINKKKIQDKKYEEGELHLFFGKEYPLTFDHSTTPTRTQVSIFDEKIIVKIFSGHETEKKKSETKDAILRCDHLNENKILQSTAASYLMPFVSKQLSDPNGIFMGVNAYNNSLVFIDPFTSRNNNINIFGVSGSGKSVTAKILMNRLFMRGIQIIVIDPEGEYVELARSLGGEVIQFSRENGINPFFIASSEENEILDHISTIKTFLKFFIPTHHYEGAILDECLIKLYDSGSPNFSNLLELLGEHQMRKDLSVLSTGSLRGVFNSERKLELTNDMIVLDLHDLKKDEKREPAMYLLTSLIWNLVNKNNDKKRMLFIDEAHKLLADPDVALFYRELVKQARKRNVGVVSVTQDVEDFLKNEYGKAIITNSETKILLKQSYATLTDIGTIYPMTDEEKTNLGHLGIGEVVLFREEEHTRLNIVVLPHEKSLVFTR